MRITIGAHKGGVGKTTSAVMLAWLLARDGTPTILIDADSRSGSATTWWDLAIKHGETWPEKMTLQRPDEWRDPLTLPPPELSHVVVDVGPGDLGRLHAAAALSDLAVMCTSPLPLDVATVGAAVADIERTGCPLVGVLLTQVHGGTVEAREVPGELREDDVPALDTVVPWSVPRYGRAAGTVPTDYSAGVYAAVLAELQTPVEA
ncbi:ParA family protein [Actinomycetospora flava]|uniref:ParA family protein n=1 Tax=Actinomycetospora flava TaxID=3129232 RepID=A0ABU8MFL0_9PSEU